MAFLCFFLNFAGRLSQKMKPGSKKDLLDPPPHTLQGYLAGFLQHTGPVEWLCMHFQRITNCTELKTGCGRMCICLVCGWSQV